MFTGIIQELATVADCRGDGNLLKYSVTLPSHQIEGLSLGASISIDGACQTVVAIEHQNVWFDAIPETLAKTTLKHLQKGQKVNIERAARFGDEIGGHILSGHIFGTARISRIASTGDAAEIYFNCPESWTKYLFSKGYVAIDGISLTLVDVSPAGQFCVHLIPETLRRTTLGSKREGNLVNIEIDANTQAIVDTVERILKSDKR